MTSIHELTRQAEAILPGAPAPDGEIDPRWQAIIEIGRHVEAHPEEVWSFVSKWGGHEQEDLRTAIATCLLEHLLEYHFEEVMPRVEAAANTDPLFGDMACRCWKLGQAEEPGNAERFDRLCRQRRLIGS
jgi:hypothetical protein